MSQPDEGDVDGDAADGPGAGAGTERTDTETDGSSRESWGPLQGVRVLDLTQMLAGPFATMLLADLGADVVKVEPPRGDMTRDNPPHLQDDEAYGGYFHSVNRNKRSVVIDLKSEAGRDTLREMVADADVLVENFKVGTMDRLGLSYESLSEINPGLVYATIRGFGDPRSGESPYADRPAFDIIAQAMGGVMSITGTEESGPVKVGPGVGDIFPATLCMVGLLSALHHAERTGEGQFVDVGMVDGVLALTERIVHQHALEGEVPGPQGNTHPLLFPFDRFGTTDGHVMIAAPSDAQWTALCEAMDRPDLIEDYPEEADRVEHMDELRPVVAEWVAQHTKEEVADLIADDVPCGPVNTVLDIFADEHFEVREMLPEIEHADTGEAVSLAGAPIKLSETPSGVHHRAPFLGEHSREVLAEYGLDGERIGELVAEGVVHESKDSEDEG
jgi:succinyl-CoA:mesaconate CoA transferase